MLSVKNDLISLSISPDGGMIQLVSLPTGERWTMDQSSLLGDGSGLPEPVQFGSKENRLPDNEPFSTASTPSPFVEGTARQLGPLTIETTRQGPAGRLTLRWDLTPEGCRVTAVPALSTVTSCTIPGAFLPEGVTAPAVVFTKNQGVWHKGTGKPFCYENFRCGHTGWTMPFYGVVGKKEALLSIIENEDDCRIWVEKTPDGRMLATWIQDASLGRLRYPRSALLRFVKPTTAAICRSYREHVRAFGEFKSWEEKIRERPNLEKMFGALICFIGYQHHPTLDYPASFRQLRQMGFDRAFVCPVWGTPSLHADGALIIAGHKKVDIRPHMKLIHDLGYLAAGWMWVDDITGTMDGALLRAGGGKQVSWRIDKTQWVRACPTAALRLANMYIAGEMKGMTGVHFDVTASRLNQECHDPNHPLDRGEDVRWKRKLLESGTKAGWVVSSEAFWGLATSSYDIGSTKIALPVHPDWYTVPMTTLVYHDSCIHDWWEIDNYNNPTHRDSGHRASRYFPMGGGRPARQAAQDALGGHPPNVFPFGAQYRWVGGKPPEAEVTYFTMDMPEVQEALRHALPVAQLHRKIGKLECVDHEVLDPAGWVQTTTFSDGTRVAANFGSTPVEVKGFDVLAPVSWRSVR